ncbi:MAG: PEP-CTERM sorting domain-containing protein [Planctomycetes bacterium]|nr:PEP-CTERM sorting domain-containing protein [Planctomycetota bacterium]
MKTKLFILMLVLMSAGAWATDYLVEDGDEFGVLSLRDYDTFLMTGGEGHDLGLGGWSSGIIEDTDPIDIPETAGGVWEITTAAYSELTINGGEFYEIVVGQESTLNLHGGDIFGSLMVDHTTAWVNIYGYGFNNDPFGGSPLTGFWADDTAFSINLVDDTISTYDQIVFHTVPEPATMILLGLGGLLVRKLKQ